MFIVVYFVLGAGHWFLVSDCFSGFDALEGHMVSGPMPLGSGVEKWFWGQWFRFEGTDEQSEQMPTPQHKCKEQRAKKSTVSLKPTNFFSESLDFHTIQ